MFKKLSSKKILLPLVAILLWQVNLPVIAQTSNDETVATGTPVENSPDEVLNDQSTSVDGSNPESAVESAVEKPGDTFIDGPVIEDKDATVKDATHGAETDTSNAAPDSIELASSDAPINPQKEETRKSEEAGVKKKKVAKKLAPNIDLQAETPVLMPEAQSKLADESNSIFLNNGLTCLIPGPLEDQQAVELSDQDLVLLGAKVLPGTSTRLAWSPGVSISGLEIPTPVLVVRGVNPGHTLCLTAATHGDELNGIEIIRRVIYDLDPSKLTGTIIGIPVVNLQGFQRGSRYLPDRRDLNRYFPGSTDGSLASRVAHSLFNEIITNCTMLVDFHTGSLRRTNLPQVRADMTNPDVVNLTEGFDDMVVVHSPGGSGMLRNAATDHGIPSVTMEVGESLRLQANQVETGVKSIFNLLGKELMYPRPFRWGEDKPVYYKSIWLRADQGGILINNVKLGTKVFKDDLLGTVTDPITNKRSEIKSTVNGRVIGMAVNQVVMRGYAAFHVGIETTEQDMIDAAQEEEKPAQDNEIEFINEEVEHDLE